MNEHSSSKAHTFSIMYCILNLSHAHDVSYQIVIEYGRTSSTALFHKTNSISYGRKVCFYFALSMQQFEIVSSVSANAAYIWPPGGEDPIEVAGVGGKTICFDLMHIKKNWQMVSPSYY